MSPRNLRFIFPLVLVIAILGYAWYPQSTGPARGSMLSSTPTTAPSRQTLRIATFNIDGGQGTDGKVDLARTARCLQRLDFISLNEVHASFGGRDNQADILAKLLKLPFVFAPAEHRWFHDSFGNAIYCALPVSRWQRIVLPAGLLTAKRNYVLTDIDWRGTLIHILSTHVDWKSGGDEQLQIVSDVFLHLPAPAILLGDLNHPPHDAGIQHLLDSPGVEESIRKIFGADSTPRVDWIFVRGLRTLDAGIVDFGASDHPAYWAEVRMP